MSDHAARTSASASGPRVASPGSFVYTGAISSIEIDYNRDLDVLAELLASVKRPGSFFASGSIETPMPRLEIEGVGTIAFPVLDSQAKEIVAQAERAPYGRGEATLVDTRVRKVWQIAPAKIRLGGRGWKKTLDSVLDMALKGLGCQGASSRD